MSRDAGTATVPDADHSVVHRSEDEYCAFPFLGGLWELGDGELLTAYFAVDCDYSVSGQGEHERVGRFGEIRGARSFDGGQTWTGDGVIADLPTVADKVLFGPDRRPSSVNLNDPETLFVSFSAPQHWREDNQPWFMLSSDGGQRWTEPFQFPKCNFASVFGEPNYTIRDDGTYLATMPVIQDDPVDGQYRPAVFASFDGASSWSFLSFVADERSYGLIHPYPLALPDGRILVAVRTNQVAHSAWVEIYESTDGGRTWSLLARPNDAGAPATLTRLDDGRLLLVYGYRRPSYGVRCRLSDDGGASWGREWVVRDGGGSVDLGYPRTVQLPDGDVLTTYYFNERQQDVSLQGTGVRYIAATRFTPPE